jgi:hypothetical protein
MSSDKSFGRVWVWFLKGTIAGQTFTYDCKKFINLDSCKIMWIVLGNVPNYRESLNKETN